MRRFQLHRDHDETGCSGTGIVAEGVVFEGGRGGPVVLHWIKWPFTVAIHVEGVDGMMAIHGHNGNTRLVWLDEESP